VDPGVLKDEGQEFEGDSAGPCWNDDENDAQAKADDVDTMNADEAEPSESLVEPLPGDSEAAVVAADSSAKRLRWLKRLRDETRAAAIPGAYYSIDKEVNQLERGRFAKTPLELEASRILRRHVEATVGVERSKLQKRRAVARQSDLIVRKTRARMAKAKRLKKKHVDSKAATKKKIDALPKVVTSSSCSAPGNKGLKARVDTLERLKMRSPPLTWPERVRWGAVRDGYSKRLAKLHKDKTVGLVFISKINDVLKGLGCHYKGNSKFNKKEGCGGDADAFSKFFAEMEKAVPTGGQTASM
jgi:hypothetical protein